MSAIRKNPPESVVTFEQLQMYKTYYDDLTENGVILQYHDRHGLAELAVIMCEMNTLREDLRVNKEWMKVNGDKGNPVMKRNPARDALEKIRPQYFRLMKEFKMTPSSRGNQVGGVVPESQGDDGDGWSKV